MITSDTPETEAAVIASGGDWSPVLRAVAQRLERERDEAREDAMRWEKLASKLGQIICGGVIEEKECAK